MSVTNSRRSADIIEDPPRQQRPKTNKRKKINKIPMCCLYVNHILSSTFDLLCTIEKYSLFCSYSCLLW